MRELAWMLVMIVAVGSLLLLSVSLSAPAIQQAAIGSMLTAIVVSTLALAIGAQAFKAETARKRAERAAELARRKAG